MVFIMYFLYIWLDLANCSSLEFCLYVFFLSFSFFPSFFQANWTTYHPIVHICAEIRNQENDPSKICYRYKVRQEHITNLYNQVSLNDTKIFKLHRIQEENGYQRASWDSIQPITHYGTPVESLRVLSLSRWIIPFLPQLLGSHDWSFFHSTCARHCSKNNGEQKQRPPPSGALHPASILSTPRGSRVRPWGDVLRPVRR